MNIGRIGEGLEGDRRRRGKEGEEEEE